ncbi:uncharacterized protein LOC143062439 isoform X2 [Mytilus galloprovincialis]|uniref:uncharacterized protein LOC143062439 isoform X2 n=1 Tax=Mytilus galloprovincialis TaxID=29158 RepID=UPI003F7BB544
MVVHIKMCIGTLTIWTRKIKSEQQVTERIRSDTSTPSYKTTTVSHKTSTPSHTTTTSSYETSTPSHTTTTTTTRSIHKTSTPSQTTTRTVSCKKESVKLTIVRDK